MALVTWSDKFNLDIPLMDEQHKKWVSILNELHDAMKGGYTQTQIGAIIKQLVDYTETHLSSEERYLKSINYPDREGHKLIHEKMVERMKELQQKYETRDSSVAVELLNFVHHWLVNHIQGADRRYAQYQQANAATQKVRV